MAIWQEFRNCLEMQLAKEQMTRLSLLQNQFHSNIKKAIEDQV